MTIKKSDKGCCCNNCGKANFDSAFKGKQVDTIFEMQTGSLVCYLCDSCLAKLTVAAIAVLNDQTEATS